MQNQKMETAYFSPGSFVNKTLGRKIITWHAVTAKLFSLGKKKAKKKKPQQKCWASDFIILSGKAVLDIWNGYSIYALLLSRLSAGCLLGPCFTAREFQSGQGEVGTFLLNS